MTVKKPLGRLEEVDLRQYWEREDADFTPWLAEEQNITILGETLGLELEVQEQEAGVGPFRADILCRNTVDGSLVLIENQLERTDHIHLGQLMTYAAGLDAVTIIWISPRFTDEHRAAIDWLNRVTQEGINLFAIQLELWQINDSLAAPKFSIVAKPNAWAKMVKESSRGTHGPLSERQRLYLEFWTAFSQHLEDNQSSIAIRTPRPDNWMGWGLGKTNFGLSASVTARDRRATVYVSLTGPEATANFRALHSDKEEIDSKLDANLDWMERDGHVESYIVDRFDADISDKDSWQRIFEWMEERLIRFDKVFRPKVKDITKVDG